MRRTHEKTQTVGVNVMPGAYLEGHRTLVRA